MKIHSKYRQNEKKNNKNKAKQQQYFLVNLCVKPLERRVKTKKRENSLHSGVTSRWAILSENNVAI